MAETRGCVGQITVKLPPEAWKHSMKRGEEKWLGICPGIF
jgi:hypothetical protein